MMKTRAAILEKIGRPLRLAELEIPGLEKGQVLVRIHFSGICRSQLNEIAGLKGKDPWLPHALGHEGSGEVLKIGDGVRKVKTGDRVVLTWVKGKGAEAAPPVYRSENRTIHAGRVATFSRLAVVSENRLVPLKQAISMECAALLGCAVLTGAGIVRRTLKLGPEHRFAVLGTGGIGMSAVLAARAAGCRRIIALDVSDWKLALAKELGATDTLKAGTGWKKDLLNLLGEEKLDAVVESAGQRSLMESALDLIHEKGTAVIAGNLKESERISIDPFELIRGKKLTGTWGGESDPDEDIPYYAGKIAAKELPVERMISHTFPLEEIQKALKTMEESRVCRVLIRMTDAS